MKNKKLKKRKYQCAGCEEVKFGKSFLKKLPWELSASKYCLECFKFIFND